MGEVEACRQVCAGADFVLHQAALGSVPRSMESPMACHEINVTGFLNVLIAARDGGVRRFVYASSSAVYGDEPGLPKTEDRLGKPLSPYAASKAIDEFYAAAFERAYGLPSIGLRYFNVFGPRQDPTSEYAAVIPRFILWALEGRPLQVHGDGTQSRDFTYVDNVVAANLLAAREPGEQVAGKTYNVGCGSRTSLLEIIAMLEGRLGRPLKRTHSGRRVGDVPHTLADIGAARRDFGYRPLVDFEEGLRRTLDFFTRRTR